MLKVVGIIVFMMKYTLFANGCGLPKCEHGQASSTTAMHVHHAHLKQNYRSKQIHMYECNMGLVVKWLKKREKTWPYRNGYLELKVSYSNMNKKCGYTEIFLMAI